MEENSGLTQRMLSLTLEIIYLLTGEDYLIVKKPGVGGTSHPNRLQVVEGFCRKITCHSPPSSRTSEDQILQLANMMIQLLTGEVPIRCQDVAVYLSMEERDYLEEHREQYKAAMMEDLQCDTPTGDLGHGDHMMEEERFYSLEDERVASDDDVTMEDEETPPHTGICEFGNLHDGTHLSAMTPEEGAASNNSREAPLYSQEDTEAGSAGILYIHIKEEPLSDNSSGISEFGNLHDGTHLSAMTPEEGAGTNNSREAPLYSQEDTEAGSAGCLDIHIKEEPLSDEDDHQVLHRPLCVKEEPQTHMVTAPDDDPVSAPHTFSHIKVEPDEPASADIYPPPIGHGKQEPILCSAGSVAPAGDVTETLAYEVTLTNVAVTGARPASVYSVCQTKDSVEILYHCPSCNLGFSSNLDLARHQVTHTVDKLFICPLCGKSFSQLSFLVKHQVIHTDLKRCLCPVCGGCFYSEASLAKHRRVHAPPAFCSVCAKCFYDQAELAKHESLHVEVRPYGCHVCGRRFITMGVLNNHLLSHMYVRGST